MRFADLMKMCFRNLHRRKGRTWLTISGVIIGCAAIVVMVSIGIGMNQASEAMLSQMGDLTKITVSPIQSSSKTKIKLDDKAVTSIAAIPHVTLAAAKDSLDTSSLQITFGDDDRYTLGYSSVYGIPDDAFQQIGYTLIEGTYPSAQPFDVIVGQYFDYSFVDSKRPDTSNTVDYWDDPTAKPFVTTFDQKVSVKTSTSSSQQTGSTDTKASLKKIQDLHVVGVMAENYDLGDETDYGIVMKLSDLKKLRKEIAQAASASGSSSSTKTTEYSSVIVKVDDMNNVADVQSTIDAMGFTTYSMETIRKPLEQQSQQLQLMLGCIGAVSLLVAAIGIANTMIMSITERTREIGIMKALGCYVKDIRREFLLEAGTIGLVGGVVGIALSEVLSYLMNTFMSSSSFGLSSDLTSLMGVSSTSTAISVIPLWLIGFAILFSVIMGLAAGFYPANKAVKISALEAIKY